MDNTRSLRNNLSTDTSAAVDDFVNNNGLWLTEFGQVCDTNYLLCDSLSMSLTGSYML